MRGDCPGEFVRLFERRVHFPVTGDQLSSSHQARSNAAMPGNTRPSTNSREAPPPVEMWEILLATPICSTAATESPPPTTLKDSALATAFATARVPSAKLSFSNIPIGPFQKIVRALAIAIANVWRVT